MVQFIAQTDKCSLMMYTYTKHIILKVKKLNMNKIINFDEVSIMPLLPTIVQGDKLKVIPPIYRFKN